MRNPFRSRFLAPAAALALALGSGSCAGSRELGSSEVQAPWIERSVRPDELLALADSAVATGRPELARRALARASEIAPASAAVHVGWGRYYVAVLRYKDAKRELDRASELDPTSPEPHYWLGLAYLGAGDRELGARSLARALRLDPRHSGARRALRPVLEERYRAAGIPAEYASLPERATLSRGELGVVLAVELGVDPDRMTWRSDASHRTDWPGLDRAWGSRWLRAAVARGWITPLADRELHLEDPVTRGALALLLARLERLAPRAPDRAAASGAERSASDTRPTRDPPDLPHGHYLRRAGLRAVALGLPLREGGRFEPEALATGSEALLAARGLAKSMGALPVVSGDPADVALVK